MADLQSLAGRLQLRLGAGLPSLVSTRREWAPTLARGKSPQALPELLAAVFSLCGGAHRVAARHALAAAARPHGDGVAAEVTPADRHALRVDTLREHLRRLWLDLPRALAGASPPADPAELAGCPLLRPLVRPQPDLEAGRAWVERHALGMPAQAWLESWQRDPWAFAEAWAEQGATTPARLLHAARPLLQGLHAKPVPLHAHASPLELQRLVLELQQDSGFALQPAWRGHTVETGTWTRLADRHTLAADDPYGPAWMRLATRVADLARLLAPGGEAWLSQGALALEGEREGLGWCEMARGLLIHWVRLDADGRIAAFRLIAPTEWNFHPYGALARLLAALPPGVPEGRVRLLAAAYDPCVDTDIRRSGGEARDA